MHEILKKLNRFFVIAMFGPNASGKGTQKSLLTKFFDRIGIKTLCISTGDLCRAYHSTYVGDSVWEAINYSFQTGELVSDEIIQFLVVKEFTYIHDNPHEFSGYVILLDGVPRTLEQASWLKEFLGQDIDLLIKLNVSREVCIERTLARNRPFDTLEDAEKRYDIFESVIAKLEDIYHEQMIIIPGEHSPEDVNHIILQELKKFFRGYYEKAFDKLWPD